MLERLVGKRRLSGLALALALGGSGLSCGSEPVKTPPEIGVVDSDNDGMPDEMERQMGTNPLKQDSDNDGFDDLYEVQHGTDPMNPDDPPQDKPDAGSLDAMVEVYDTGRRPDAQTSDNGYDAGVRPDTGHPDAGFQDSGERDAGASMYPICRVGGPYEVRVYEFFDLDLVALGSYDPNGMRMYCITCGNGTGGCHPRGQFFCSYANSGTYNITAVCTNSRDETSGAETTVLVRE